MQQNLVRQCLPTPSSACPSGAELLGQGGDRPAAPPGALELALVDETVFCCSHVELEYFEVYFLYEITGSLTFQIAPFLLWKI